MKAFVIRVWTPGADEVEAHGFASDLHGVVEPVGSREPKPFKSGVELLAFLRGQVQGIGHEQAAGGRRR
ncbi:MAG: hypothetical protein ACRDNY_12795 [Gaiellaceae bacterium]